MTVSHEVLAAFTDWVNAELGSHYAQPCPDEVMDHLTSVAGMCERHLGELPAATADDLLIKLFPLLLANLEPARGEPPMIPSVTCANGQPEFLASVLDDLRRLCPEIAKVMKAPHYLDQRRRSA